MPDASSAMPAPGGQEVAQPCRLPAGGVIDRRERRQFRFDNKIYFGYAGDSLASALLANDVKLVGRSFKYHRPRGILTAGSEEPNALVELRNAARREPNTRATVVELYEGLEAASQNRFPSLKFDLLSINSLLSPILGAGFYYKTFMWPAKFWERLYEPLIRRAAGLGRASGLPDPDRYEKSTAFCDVLVIGGGTAGIAAAMEAARLGEQVILCEEDFAFGGFALAEGQRDEIAARLAELRQFSNVRLLRRTSVFGVYDGGTYGAIERVADHLPEPPLHLPRQRYWKIVAARSVLATGVTEVPLLFSNNDMPGVMLSGAVRSYIGRFGVLPGRKAVLCVNNDEALGTLGAMHRAGIFVTALIDSRSEIPQSIRDEAARCGAKIIAGGMLRRALGGSVLRAVEVASTAGTARLECDLLAISGGWNPNLALTAHLGGGPVWDGGIGGFVPAALPPGMQVVGAATGRSMGGAQNCGQPTGNHGKIFVDFQNDVTVRDIKLARQEGFSAPEHLKRYTTLGMATDQGRTANVNGLALLAAASRRPVGELGGTRARPPYTPVAIGALAGMHRGQAFRPRRLTPTHDWAKAHGAVFVTAGMWLRAQYFPWAGETDWLQTVCREVSSVREEVGFCDVTTLGKIDLQGPDVARFLDFVYSNGWSNLAVGRARYGLMLREDGFVMDDGTCARLGEQHFLMTTTTANAAKVMQHLEFCHQWLWPELRLRFCSVTDQWAQIAVSGPKSRDTLRRIIDPIYDISDAALPYMGVSQLTACGGVRARLFRLSFSGELGYELAVPARFGAALAARLMQAGACDRITPYGTEALGVMRVEKGHPAGNELNGQTTAHDLGLAKLLSKKKDFIGRAMAARPDLTDTARPTLIGLRPVERADRLRAGAHLLPQGAEAVARNDQGHVTSVAFSPGLGSWIGLGLLQNGPVRLGEVIRVYDPVRNGDLLAEVVHPVFYDPQGSRLHG